MCTIWPFCQRQSKDIAPTWRTSLSLVQVQILGNTPSSLLSSCHPTSWRMQRPNTKIQWNKPASLRAKNPERAAPSPWTSLGFVAWEKMEVFQRCMQGSGTNRLCCTYRPGTAKAGIGNVPLIQRAAGGAEPYLRRVITRLILSAPSWERNTLISPTFLLLEITSSFLCLFPCVD